MRAAVVNKIQALQHCYTAIPEVWKGHGQVTPGVMNNLVF